MPLASAAPPPWTFSEDDVDFLHPVSASPTVYGNDPGSQAPALYANVAPAPAAPITTLPTATGPTQPVVVEYCTDEEAMQYASVLWKRTSDKAKAVLFPWQGRVHMLVRRPYERATCSACHAQPVRLLSSTSWFRALTIQREFEYLSDGIDSQRFCAECVRADVKVCTTFALS